MLDSNNTSIFDLTTLSHLHNLWVLFRLTTLITVLVCTLYTWIIRRSATVTTDFHNISCGALCYDSVACMFVDAARKHLVRKHRTVPSAHNHLPLHTAVWICPFHSSQKTVNYYPHETFEMTLNYYSDGTSKMTINYYSTAAFVMTLNLTNTYVLYTFWHTRPAPLPLLSASYLALYGVSCPIRRWATIIITLFTSLRKHSPLLRRCFYQYEVV